MLDSKIIEKWCSIKECGPVYETHLHGGMTINDFQSWQRKGIFFQVFKLFHIQKTLMPSTSQILSYALEISLSIMELQFFFFVFFSQ